MSTAVVVSKHRGAWHRQCLGPLCDDAAHATGHPRQEFRHAILRRHGEHRVDRSLAGHGHQRRECHGHVGFGIPRWLDATGEARADQVQVFLLDPRAKLQAVGIEDREVELRGWGRLAHHRLRGDRAGRPGTVPQTSEVDHSAPRGPHRRRGTIGFELLQPAERLGPLVLLLHEGGLLLGELQRQRGPELLEREPRSLRPTTHLDLAPGQIEQKFLLHGLGHPLERKLGLRDVEPRPLKDHFLRFLGEILVLVHGLELPEFLAGVLQPLLRAAETEAGRLLLQRSVDREKPGEILGGDLGLPLGVGHLQWMERLGCG